LDGTFKDFIKNSVLFQELFQPIGRGEMLSPKELSKSKGLVLSKKYVINTMQ
jgi:hypothetical protein